jgi:hypothetical protein
MRGDPFGQLVCFAATCGVERGQVVVADPVDVRATLQQVLGRRLLAAVADLPERPGNLDWCRRRRVCEARFEALVQSEGGRVPELDLRAAFDEAAGCVPLSEPARWPSASRSPAWIALTASHAGGSCTEKVAMRHPGYESAVRRARAGSNRPPGPSTASISAAGIDRRGW